MADNNKVESKNQRKPRRNWFKETFSELKKVSWPKFSTVVKQTGAVLLLVAVFLVVLFGFDMLLSFLYRKLFGVSSAALLGTTFKAFNPFSLWWLL